MIHRSEPNRLQRTQPPPGSVFFLFLVSLVSLLFLAQFLQAAAPLPGSGGSGFKLLTNYRYIEDYGHHPQNWAITRDSRGMVYVCNQAGVLEYDGVSWRRIFLPNWSARSMAIHNDGTIYVGGKGEIGFLETGKKGALQYTSLLEHVPQDKRDFSNVYFTYATPQGIYFNSFKRIFHWDPAQRRMTTLESKHRFLSSFFVRNQFMVCLENRGLMIMKDNKLEPAPGGQAFADLKIACVIPLGTGPELLIGTRNRGLFLYDLQRGAVRFKAAANDYLIEKKLYRGIRLDSGHMALATLRGGVVIITPAGETVRVIDKSAGLQDDNVKHVYQDRSGNLWLALNNGLAKVEYASPFSIYDHRSALPGMIMAIARSRNSLYVGTTSGLFVFNGTEAARPVPGLNSVCWALLPDRDGVLAGMDNGVAAVRGEKTRRVSLGCSFVLHRSAKDSNRVWVGNRKGLASIYKKNGRWEFEQQYAEIKTPVRTIAGDKKHPIWLGTLGKGVIKIETGEAGLKPAIKRTAVYGTEHGLPPVRANVYYAAGHIMIATDRGVYRVNAAGDAIVPDNTLGKQFAGDEKGKSVFRVAQDKNRVIWFHSMARNFKAVPLPGGGYRTDSRPFLRLPLAQVNAIYPGQRTVWFGTVNNLIKFDMEAGKHYDRRFPVFIRRVRTTGDKTNLFDGALPGTSPLPVPELPYKKRDLRFEFAAPYFVEESQTQYQWKLEGYDEKWSDWTKETHWVYTNLNAGHYRFRVRAENVYGIPGQEDSFRFRVLPPWHQTWWAYMFYGLGLFFIVSGAVKWRSRKLEKEKKDLEAIVHQRTRQIEEKNLLLEHQSEQLKELDKAKSRFFANISHEFRTPLTLIMGPLEQILSNGGNGKMKKMAPMMLGNAQRLLRLVNQLLELAKTDSGKMKLQTAPANIVPFLEKIIDCFESLTGQYRMALSFQPEAPDITVYFDPDKMEKVFLNLLSNAVKFTPAGGEITVSIRAFSAIPGGFPKGGVEIVVADTGIGIPKNRLDHIFDRFYFSDSVHEFQRKGAGIGLSLTKELVELHCGDIRVESSTGDSPGEQPGTRFFVRLPLGTQHLQEGQVTEPTDTPPVPGAVYPVPCSLTTDIQEIPRVREREPAASEEEKTGQPLVLVVEDNAEMRGWIKSILEPVYRVEEAANGEQGIKTAGAVIPDLVISDIKMPVADGIQLCRALKKSVRTCHIPVILITARGTGADMIKGYETGADDYITKPFSPRALMLRIANLLELRRQSQQDRSREMAGMPGQIPVSPVDRSFMLELREAVEQQIADPNFNVQELSRILYMSRSSLYNKIVALTGETPQQFIRSFRLLTASRLLSARYGNVNEVAERVGFSNTAYFTRCFKQKFHQVPSHYHEPTTESTTESTTEPAMEPPIENKNKPVRVLVVEDNPQARQYIKESLQPRFHISEAADGKEGFEKAKSDAPDLIISDIMMPEMDGFELCRLLKTTRETSHIPVILLTAKASEESLIEGLETGADDYVTKPFNAALLEARVKNLVRLRRGLQSAHQRHMTLLPVEIPVQSVDEEFLRDLKAAVEKHLSDPEFSVEQLSKLLYMGRATLYRKILALTGQTPTVFIRSYRLKRAAELLEANAGNVTQVAFQVGFNDTSYFTQCFKEVFHRLPSSLLG